MVDWSHWFVANFQKRIMLILFYLLLGGVHGNIQPLLSYYPVKTDPITIIVSEVERCYTVPLEHFDGLKDLIGTFSEDTYAQIPGIKTKLDSIDDIIDALPEFQEKDLSSECESLDFNFKTYKEVLESRHNEVRPKRDVSGGRFKREVEKPQYLITSNPDAVLVSNNSLVLLDDLMKHFCLSKRLGGKLTSSLTKQQCILQILSNTKHPAILNIGQNGRIQFEKAVSGLKTRGQLVFLEKAADILRYKYRNTNEERKKDELINLLHSYTSLEKMELNPPVTTAAPVITTAQIPTTMSSEQVLAALKDNMEETLTVSQKNEKSIETINLEDNIEDLNSFKSSLALASHILSIFQSFLRDPLKSTLFPHDFDTIESIQHNKADNKIYLKVFESAKELAFEIAPVDLCGYSHCIHIQSSSTYYAVDEEQGYVKEFCSFVRSNTYKCKSKVKITDDTCMILRPLPEIYSEGICILEDAGAAPANSIFSYTNFLIITTDRTASANFGNLELLPNKLYRLTTNVANFYTINKAQYYLESTDQAYTYDKKELPFTPDILDQYYSYLFSSQYSENISNYLYAGSGGVSVTYVILIIFGIIIWRNKKTIKRMRTREKKNQKKWERLRRSFTPSAPSVTFDEEIETIP